MQVEAAANALITAEELKSYFQPPTPERYDRQGDYLQFLINAVSSVFQKYCGLPLIQVDGTDTYNGQDGIYVLGAKLFLRCYPVVTGAGITFTVREDWGGGFTTLTQGTDFLLFAEAGYLVRIAGAKTSPTNWVSGYQAIEVTARAGRWATVDEVDPDLKLAAVEACKLHHDFGPAALGMVMTDRGDVMKADNPLRRVKATLDRYRKRRM